MKKNTQDKKKYIIEPIKEETNFIPAEVNLEKLPFFAPYKKKQFKKNSLTYSYTKNIVENGKVIQLKWMVAANPKYGGFLNHFDRDIYRCLQKIIMQRGLPSNGIFSFSIYEIIQMLGKTDKGRIYKEIKNSLQKMTAATIEAYGALYDKNNKKYLDGTFHIFESFITVGETSPYGGTAETNYLKINEWFLNSMCSGYLKPIDFDYYFSLKNPIAKALYSKLSIDFYGLGEKSTYLQKCYSKLCQELIITYQKFPSKAKQILKPALEELQKTGFLSKVEFESIPNNKHDFYIKFYPGKRAKEPNNFKTIYPKAVEVFEPKFEPQQDKKLLTINKNNTPKQEIIDIVDSVKDELSEEDRFILNGLLDVYVSEPTALECVKKYKEKTKYWLEAKKYDGRYQKASTKAGFILMAIKRKWTSPEYEQHLQKEKQQEIRKIQTEKEELEKRRRELEKKEENLKLEDFYNSLPKPEQEKIELDILDRLKKENQFLYDKYKEDGLGIGIKAVLNEYRYKEIKNLRGK